MCLFTGTGPLRRGRKQKPSPLFKAAIARACRRGSSRRSAKRWWRVMACARLQAMDDLLKKLSLDQWWKLTAVAGAAIAVASIPVRYTPGFVIGLALLA